MIDGYLSAIESFNEQPENMSTELIKQWINKESANLQDLSSIKSARNGLTKGIEIAEGFAEWVEEVYAHEGEGKWYDVRKIKDDSNPVEFLTTSQLLEKYLQHLSSINKES